MPRDKAAAAPSRRPSARRGQGDRLREEIIDATMRLIEETGDPGALSLRQVAREVGVAATSIYLHFDSLTDLISVTKSQGFSQLTAELERAAAQAPDPSARIRAYAHAYMHYGQAHRGLYQAWFTSAPVSPPTDSTETFIGEAAFTKIRDDLAVVVGLERAPMLVMQFWCGLHGMVMLRTHRPHLPWPDLDQQVDNFVDILLD